MPLSQHWQEQEADHLLALEEAFHQAILTKDLAVVELMTAEVIEVEAMHQ